MDYYWSIWATYYGVASFINFGGNILVNKLVSVIIPVYNVVDYLQQSVESILNQTYDNLQIILVDDGSTDGSSYLVDFLKLNDRRIEVIHKQNEGLSVARNVGLAIAAGEYVYFFDSDDIVESSLIEDAVRFLEFNKADFVSFTHDIVNDKNQYLHGKINNREYKSSKIISKEKLISNILIGKVRIAAWSYIFRKEIFVNGNISFQKGKKYEDNDTTILAILSSKKTGILKSKSTPYYHYRQRSNSITGYVTKSNYYDLISMTNNVGRIIENNTKISHELDLYILNQYISAFRILKIVGGTKEEYLEINRNIKTHISFALILRSKKTIIKFLYWIFWHKLHIYK